MSECAVDDCSRADRMARGMCSMHYQRWRKHGDPERGGMGAPRRDSSGYDAAHCRVRHDRGRAHEHHCAHCGGQATTWAYTHDAPDERIDAVRGHPFSLDPNYYIPLCKRCHNKFDKKEVK